MLVQESLRPGGAARKLMRRVGDMAGRTGGSRRRLPTPYLELETEPDWWAEPDYEYVDQVVIRDTRRTMYEQDLYHPHQYILHDL